MTTPLRHRVDQVLDQVGTHAGLAGCRLDEAGVAEFALDGLAVRLDLDETEARLVPSAPLGEPEHVRAEAYGTLLDANYSWFGTAGAALARDPDSRTIVLQCQVPAAALAVAESEAALQRFADAAEALRATLAAPGVTDATAPGRDGGMVRA